MAYGLLIILLFPISSHAQGSIPIFTKVGSDPVLKVTAVWEGQYVRQASMIFDEGKFKTWYTAGHLISGDEVIGSIGYATSNDGMSWAKYDKNPVLTPTSGGFDSDSVSFVSVVRVGNQYRMYYRGLKGQNSQMGLATSSDGITWTKYGLPLFSGTHPTVIFSGNQWKAWYRNASLGIGYATSSDGSTWNVGSSNLQTPSGFQDVYAPNVVLAGGVYNMWFTACCTSGPEGTGGRLFYSTSTDGINWTGHDENPLSGDTLAGYASVLTTGQVNYLWYSKDFSIYLATTTTPIPEFGSTSTVVVLLATVVAALFSRKPWRPKVVNSATT